jgi:drug/metabolite transporter (DMT)-like permease
VGIVLVVIGVALVVYEQPAPPAEIEGKTPEVGGGRLSVSGLLFALGAALGQAVGGLMSRVGMAGNVSALDASLVRLAGGLVGIVLIVGSSGGLQSTARALRTPRTLAAIAGASVVGTYLGIWLSQYAIGHATSTAVASTLMATSPIFALPLGRWLNGDRITPRALGGTIVAVGGLALLTLGEQ